MTLDAVLRAAGDAALLSAGGFIDTPNQRMAVRQLVSITSADDLARSLVAFRNGAAIRLGDVANVVIGHPAPIGDAVLNDGPGLLLIVEKQPWGNTLDVTREVERALADLKPGVVFCWWPSAPRHWSGRAWARSSCRTFRSETSSCTGSRSPARRSKR